jgi:hypothetical protein
LIVVFALVSDRDESDFRLADEEHQVHHELTRSLGSLSEGEPDGSSNTISNTACKQADHVPVHPPDDAARILQLRTDGSDCDQLLTMIEQGGLHTLLRIVQRTDGENSDAFDSTIKWIKNIVVSCCEPHSSSAADVLAVWGFATGETVVELMREGIGQFSGIEECMREGSRERRSLDAGICVVHNVLGMILSAHKTRSLHTLSDESLLSVVKQLMCLRLDARVSCFEELVMQCIDVSCSEISDKQWHDLGACDDIAYGLASWAFIRHWVVAQSVRLLVGQSEFVESRLREVRANVAMKALQRVHQQSEHATPITCASHAVEILEECVKSFTTDEESNVWRSSTIVQLVQAVIAFKANTIEHDVDHDLVQRIKAASESLRNRAKTQPQRMDCILLRERTNFLDRLASNLTPN